MTTLLLAAQAVDGGTSMLILMVAVLAIVWLFTTCPQQKRQKEIRNFQDALQEGSKVIINGDVYGTAKRIDLTTNRVDAGTVRGVTVQVDHNFLHADTASQNTTNA